jgi:RNA polymerase sigma-70 factor (ECF subfamily)
MSGDIAFQQLVGRVRSGDDAAAAELVRLYEPAVRRVIRLRLAHTRLRRRIDSVDVVQSVMASFFVRAALGQYELDSPAHLVKLLAAMARNKVTDQARKHRKSLDAEAAMEGDNPETSEEPAPDPSPSHLVSARDLLDQVRARLSEDERQLADRRALGREWAEIAAEFGGTPDALRKKLSRAVERVAQELGLDG